MAPCGGEIEGVDPHCIAYKRIFDEISDRFNKEMMGSFGLEMGETNKGYIKDARPGIMALMQRMISK
ncbi:MAG: hypothetical protein NTW84_00595 [Methanothrix sp.]|nr:hypothetical protein [Methanothrix sp.]